MIKEFVDRFMARKELLEDEFKEDLPSSYKELVKRVVELITSKQYTPHAIDPERIHEIDDGDYQGTLLYVIGAKGYQPSTYYYVHVDYGSCSGCDTLEHILCLDEEQQVKDMMTLALHIVQKLKLLEEGDEE